MTWETFLGYLSQTRNRGEWYLDGHSLRFRDLNSSREYCPVTAIVPIVLGDDASYFTPWQWEAAAEAIGLPYRLASNIVSAADYDADTSSQALRRELLAVLGLEDRIAV
jgi:hypothetical protein